jgi:hypothetical protein
LARPRERDQQPEIEDEGESQTPITLVLSKLHGVTPKGNGKGWRALCPVHGDTEPSLNVTAGNDGQAVLNCFVGCKAEEIVKKLGLTMPDLFPREMRQQPRRTPITLEMLAGDKGLPAAFLKSLGLRDLAGGGVAIPYRDVREEEICAKRRTALKAKEGSYWPQGRSLLAYGLDRLTDARQAGELVLVEGESDCWTLWHHGFPALGIPGAGATSTLQADHLDGIDRLLIVQEPDTGGPMFVQGIAERLQQLGWHGSAFVVKLDNAKDPNDLHKQAPRRFKKAFRHGMDRAKPLESAMVLLEPDVSGGANNENPWLLAKAAPVFLAEADGEFEGLARDILAPGAITIVAAPRGLGKTQMAMALAVALATGGEFRGEVVKPVQVLLLDRDNPEQTIKQRLRGWGAEQAQSLHILTRQHAPDLKDKKAWDIFPIEAYDVLILDSVGSSTEGITEKEGKQTTEVLATIVDLARRGLAILLLQNTTKDGTSLKGRGEWADRVDIIYEVRDATDHIPSGKGPWWQGLPDPGEKEWSSRAGRRKGRDNYRLAFIPSKFRLGPEPEPFCLEVRLPKEGPWTIKDVTAELAKTGELTKAEAERTRLEKLDGAAEALASLVADRAREGRPVLKNEAETYLQKQQGLEQGEARQILKDMDGVLWRIEPAPHGKGKGNALALLPVEEEACLPEEGNRQNTSCEALSNGYSQDALSVALDGSDPPTNRLLKPQLERSHESIFVGGENSVRDRETFEWRR